MRMMGIGHLFMHVPQRLMSMPMTVFACGHRGVTVVVVAVVVTVRVFMLQRFVGVFMAMGFGKMQHHASRHQRTAQCHQGCNGSAAGAAALGLIFGLNIPACAAPLIPALLALAAAGGASIAELGAGFVSLGLFGLALSLPPVLAVFFEPMRALLDRLAALSRRIPRWTGLLFILRGLWSIWFGLFVSLRA